MSEVELRKATDWRNLKSKEMRIKALQDKLSYAIACRDKHTEYECIKPWWDERVKLIQTLIKKENRFTCC